MNMEGAMVHTKCGGTGFTAIEDGSIDVCVECMGSGMVHIGIEMGDHPNWIRENAKSGS
jgi:hypothetical protein